MRLFEPGSVTSPRAGRVKGWMGRRSGSGMKKGESVAKGAACAKVFFRGKNAGVIVVAGRRNLAVARGAARGGDDGGWKPSLRSRQGTELVAVGFAAFDAGGDFDVVAVGEGSAQAVEFVFEAAESAEDFVAVLLEDGAPDVRVAAGDASGVTEAAAGVVAPRGVFLREKSAEAGRDDLREMADVRDDFVVLIGGDGDDLGTEGMPEGDDGRGGGGRGVGERSDEAGAVLKEDRAAVFPTGFLGAGHGVGADEVGAGGKGGVAEAGDLALHAAHVSDESAGREIRRDLSGERDDLIDGGGDHDEAGAADGFAGRIGDGVAPRLFAELEARFGAAGPEHDPRGDAVDAGGAGDRATEESGGENRELGEVGHCREARKNARWCREGLRSESPNDPKAAARTEVVPGRLGGCRVSDSMAGDVGGLGCGDPNVIARRTG